MSPEEDRTRDTVDSEPKHYQLSYSGPWQSLKLQLLELYLVGWIIKLMREGRKPESPEKSPDDKLQKMPHAKAWRFKPQARLKPAQ